MENSNSIRLLSIGLGVLMLFHGIDKVINGIDPIIGMLEGAGIPYANYIALGVFVGEIIAPLLLIAGQYVRTAGAIIAFNMLVAILLAHRQEIISLNDHGAWSIELPALYLIGGLTLALMDRPKKA